MDKQFAEWIELIQRDEGILNHVTSQYKQAMSEMLNIIMNLASRQKKPEPPKECCNDSDCPQAIKTDKDDLDDEPTNKGFGPSASGYEYDPYDDYYTDFGD